MMHISFRNQFSLHVLSHCGTLLNSLILAHLSHIWAQLPPLPTKCLKETCSACPAAFSLPITATALNVPKLINAQIILS